MIIALCANEYLPSANADSVSAAEHRRFPTENHQSRVCGGMIVRLRRNEGEFPQAEISIKIKDNSSGSFVSACKAGVQGAQPNEQHLPVDSDGFPWKTAVFSRRGRADC